jgi:hypothetical protein
LKNNFEVQNYWRVIHNLHVNYPCESLCESDVVCGQMQFKSVCLDCKELNFGVLSLMIPRFILQELKWQAASILGSVDFLGSPLGFVNDVTEGVSGLLFEGNVQALVQNVTHGLSNSAAKVTGRHACHGLLCSCSWAGHMF